MSLNDTNKISNNPDGVLSKTVRAWCIAIGDWPAAASEELDRSAARESGGLRLRKRGICGFVCRLKLSRLNQVLKRNTANRGVSIYQSKLSKNDYCNS